MSHALENMHGGYDENIHGSSDEGGIRGAEY
jgi:hypothetical protein